MTRFLTTAFAVALIVYAANSAAHTDVPLPVVVVLTANALTIVALLGWVVWQMLAAWRRMDNDITAVMDAVHPPVVTFTDVELMELRDWHDFAAWERQLQDRDGAR
jgi:hypothetical protein